MLPLTVKDIRELIKALPDDAVISYERIEDVYFEKHGRVSEKVPDMLTPKSGDDIGDEFVNAEVAYFDSNKNKLRFSAHY